MSAPQLTPSLIACAGMDAGFKSARKHGRAAWSVDDLEAATAEVERLVEATYGPGDLGRALFYEHAQRVRRKANQ